jgi:hypothetical protein
MIPSESENISDYEVENLARSGVEDLKTTQNATILDTECEGYKIDGMKACSYLASTGGTATEELLIVKGVTGQVGETWYAFTYGSPPRHFVKNLETFDRMLQSFNATQS